MSGPATPASGSNSPSQLDDVDPLYADVLVPRRFRHPFTYRVPPLLRDAVRVGSQVEIPFGRAQLYGVVVSYPVPAPPAAVRVKNIRRVRDTAEVSAELLELSQLVSTYYLAPWGQCLRLILPPNARGAPVVRYDLTAEGRAALEHPGRPSRARAVLSRLASARGGLAASSLAQDLGGGLDATLRTLVRKGWVEAVDYQPRHRPAPAPANTADLPVLKTPAPVPTSAWWSRLYDALDYRQPRAFLVEGAAGPRLSAIVEACEAAIGRGLSALIVAPELARVASIRVQARARWGERVAELHGSLSEQQRSIAWRRIRDGDARVVIGTRAAIFAPFSPSAARPLGLLCIEGEEDASLKEEQEPQYHAREVARLRAEQHAAVRLLASGHPSLETLTSVPSEAHLVLPHPDGRPAAITVVDLRQNPAEAFLSPPMLEGIRTALQAGTGAVLYLNRKGSASGLSCRECGAVPHCPHCSVAFRYYAASPLSGAPSTSTKAAQLRCLYCGTLSAVTDLCGVCRSPRVQPIGVGTARLEEEIRRRFPHARVGRLDADTARRPHDAAKLWRMATVGGFDVLIGTQMLFQGPPLPPAGFVGMPLADAGLHVPDFRSAERTYHGLLDAARLAQTAEAGGGVVLQTYMPTHHAVTAIQNQNPLLFYEAERTFRQATGYPPFATLINLRVSGASEAAVQQAADRWATLLVTAEEGTPGKRIGGVGSIGSVLVLGPVPAPVSRIRGRYRWQLLMKSPDGAAARQRVEATLTAIEASDRALKFEVDVDPVDLV